MDLSGMIFVALAIAWAVYLIPKALQHHDEMARTRGVETFSARMRVFTRRTTSASSDEAPVEAPAATIVETFVETDVEAQAATAPDPAEVAPTVRAERPVRPASREAARKAASRRRTVLWSLVVVLGIVGAAAGVGYLPMWSVGIPVVLIVAFLVIARTTVRREQARRVGTPVSRRTRPVEPARVAAPVAGPVAREVSSDREDTMGLNRAELAEPDAMPLEDEGSLWDPLPVTLPTYVSKPRARRTVRTIELTQSSGHDPIDSALVRNAEVVAPADMVDPEPEVPEELEGPGERRAAGA